LRLSAFELRLGLCHIEVAGDARLVAVLRQFQRALVGDGRLREQVRLRVERAQREVINRHLGLHGEFRGFEIIGGRSEGGARAFNLPTDASPQIQLPARIPHDVEQVEGRARSSGGAGGRSVCAGALARR
jgi:hypothetical protein